MTNTKVLAIDLEAGHVLANGSVLDRSAYAYEWTEDGTVNLDLRLANGDVVVHNYPNECPFWVRPVGV